MADDIKRGDIYDITTDVLTVGTMVTAANGLKNTVKNGTTKLKAPKVGSVVDDVGEKTRRAKIPKVEIPEQSLKHAGVGDFTVNPSTGKVSKMKGGGHGQSNIDFLKENGFEVNIEKLTLMVLELEMYHTIKRHPNVLEQGNHGFQKIGQIKI